LIIIKHRVNSAKELINISSSYGIEIDLRSSGSDLILAHDPFLKGELLIDWLQFYTHKLLILNLKEDGLEKKVMEIMRNFQIDSYFFLDLSFPALYKLSNDQPDFCSARVSEFEPVSSALQLNPGWLWFDSHSGNWDYLIEAFKLLKNIEIQTCLVSPELQRVNFQDEFVRLNSILKDNNIVFNAVCTKFPEQWV
jgi:hypothetical protein